jgi:hypothetical protein
MVYHYCSHSHSRKRSHLLDHLNLFRLNSLVPTSKCTVRYACQEHVSCSTSPYDTFSKLQLYNLWLVVMCKCKRFQKDRLSNIHKEYKRTTRYDIAVLHQQAQAISHSKPAPRMPEKKPNVASVDRTQYLQITRPGGSD